MSCFQVWIHLFQGVDFLEISPPFSLEKKSAFSQENMCSENIIFRVFIS